MTLWPVTEPDDEAAVFASSFTKRLDIAISVRSDLDADRFIDSIAASLTEIGAPVIDPLAEQDPAGSPDDHEPNGAGR